MLSSEVMGLDLDAIKIKLMDHREGEGWTREQADAVEQHYRRFLDVQLKYPDRAIVPSSPVDKFWHYHILDTMKYAEDCQSVFGRFLDHFPYFGMRGDEDAANLQRAYGDTNTLMATEYPNDIPVLRTLGLAGDDASVCDTTPNCYGSSCNGSKCGGEAVGTYARPTFTVSSRSNQSFLTSPAFADARRDAI